MMPTRPVKTVINRESRKRARSGFTLIETMMALLILVLLTGIVATGIPVAFETYNKAVSASNAQAALSTTTTLLRDELSLARDVELADDGSGKVERYLTSDGYWAMIQNPADGAYAAGLVKQAYGSDGVETATFGDPKPLIPTALLRGANQADGNSGGKNDLRVELDSITYANGVFTVGGLRVLMVGGAEVASFGHETDGKLEIRAAFIDG